MIGWRVFTALAGLLAAASAAVAPRMTAEELVAQSELIVRGHVTRSWPAWDSRHKYIWTHYEVAVAEMLRGLYSTTVTVSEPGGTLDGVSMQTSGAVPFAAGEDAVLFLYKTPIGYWRVVGGPQGKFTVDREGRVRTGSYGVTLVDPPGGATLGTSLAMLQGIPMSDFVTRVRRLADAHPYLGAQ
jgi:hypothetical protein